jgi:hypothetical protein
VRLAWQLLRRFRAYCYAQAAYVGVVGEALEFLGSQIIAKGATMAFDIKRVAYYSTTVERHAGEGSKLLSLFAGVGVSLLAFKAVPLEPLRTRFTLFPDDALKMAAGAKKAGLDLDGPHAALLIQGDDQSGALADIYEKLSQADINVNESSGIAGIKGSYGVILYLEPEDCEKAIAALET